MNSTSIFVNNSELNWSGHIFAYYVIKKIAELESIKQKELRGEEIEKIISKVNKNVQELQQNIESIDSIQNIADSLKTTCKNKLDELINFSNTYKGSTTMQLKEG